MPITGPIKPLDKNGAYSYTKFGSYEFTIDFGKNVNSNSNFTFEAKSAYQIFVTSDHNITAHLQNSTTLTDKGESLARVFNGLLFASRVQLSTTENEESTPTDFGKTDPKMVSSSQRLIYANFFIDYTTDTGDQVRLDGEISSKNGPIYILLQALDDTGTVVLKQITEEEPWSINIFLQTPQYIIMSFGECLFSVTGLGFAYTQAPPSMKSILTAIWLLTVCFGNIIIIIVQGASSTISQATEFFFFSGLMFLTTFIFGIMSLFYTYVTPRSLNDPEIKVTCTKPNDYDNLGLAVNENGEYAKIDDFYKQNDKLANEDFNATQF